MELTGAGGQRIIEPKPIPITAQTRQPITDESYHDSYSSLLLVFQSLDRLLWTKS